MFMVFFLVFVDVITFQINAMHVLWVRPPMLRSIFVDSNFFFPFVQVDKHKIYIVRKVHNTVVKPFNQIFNITCTNECVFMYEHICWFHCLYNADDFNKYNSKRFYPVFALVSSPNNQNNYDQSSLRVNSATQIHIIILYSNNRFVFPIKNLEIAT